MKIRQDQLSDTLRKGVGCAYLVSGNEPLLVMEACDEIRQAARAQGFDEREVFHVEGSFEWRQLLEEANSMSLFSTRRILEIRLNNDKPSDKGAVLEKLVSQPNPDNLILLVCPQLDAAAQRSAWCKAFEQKGIFLPVWPIERNQYAGWLKRRLQIAGLQMDANALQLMAHQTEGNLLAAVQEIEKLKLLGQAQITEDMVQQAIGDSARFDTFGLADACLDGRAADAVRMLNHLQAEGVEPILILAAFTYKIRQLISLQDRGHQTLSDAFSQQRIWPKQQAVLKRALQNLPLSTLHQALKLAKAIDDAVKGSGNNAWLLLNELTVLLSGVKLRTRSQF